MLVCLKPANKGGIVKSLVVKHSIVIGGHKTSVSLEDAFWSRLKQIASNRRLALSELGVATVDSERVQGNLSSALRLFVLDQYRSTIEAPGRVAFNTDQSREPSPRRSAEANAA